MENLCAQHGYRRFWCSRNPHHFETHQDQKYNSFQGQLRWEKTNTLLVDVKKNSIPLSTSREVALLPSSDTTSKLRPSPPLLPPGHLAFKLSGPSPLITAIIYRPPKTHLSFFSDFPDLLTQLFTISPSILLLGDFNFHLDRTDSKPAIEFLEVLQSLNLNQHINFATDENPETTVRATALKICRLYGLRWPPKTLQSCSQHCRVYLLLLPHLIWIQ